MEKGVSQARLSSKASDRREDRAARAKAEKCLRISILETTSILRAQNNTDEANLRLSILCAVAFGSPPLPFTSRRACKQTMGPSVKHQWCHAVFGGLYARARARALRRPLPPPDGPLRLAGRIGPLESLSQVHEGAPKRRAISHRRRRRRPRRLRFHCCARFVSRARAFWARLMMGERVAAVHSRCTATRRAQPTCQAFSEARVERGREIHNDARRR